MTSNSLFVLRNDRPFLILACLDVAISFLVRLTSFLAVLTFRRSLQLGARSIFFPFLFFSALFLFQAFPSSVRELLLALGFFFTFQQGLFRCWKGCEREGAILVEKVGALVSEEGKL